MDTRPKIVAVAEDDPDDRLLLKDAFEQCGQNVQLEFFGNGSSLLDFLCRHENCARFGRQPDLILMDFHLPGTSIPELIRTIKSDSGLKRIPLIILTGYSPETDILNCYELGANTVINKPDSFGELLQAVRSVCDYWFGMATD